MFAVHCLSAQIPVKFQKNFPKNCSDLSFLKGGVEALSPPPPLLVIIHCILKMSFFGMCSIQFIATCVKKLVFKKYVAFSTNKTVIFKNDVIFGTCVSFSF